MCDFCFGNIVFPLAHVFHKENIVHRMIDYANVSFLIESLFAQTGKHWKTLVRNNISATELHRFATEFYQYPEVARLAIEIQERFEIGKLV